MTATLASRYELIVFDLDGVVYLGTEAVPEAASAISAVVASGTAVAYATNNASRRAVEVAELLCSLGVPAGPDEVLTSAVASARLLAEDLEPGSAVLVVGAPALVEEVRSVGLRPVHLAAERPAAVVQGYGPNVDWGQLAEASLAIRAGARWVATNVDATMPSPRGPLPGNGSLVAAVRTALGGRAPDTVVGKPEPTMLVVAARGLDGPRHTLVVGDRLDTDMECAVRAGMDGLLVLTGVSAPGDLLRAGAHERPTHVGADLAVLLAPDDSARIPAWHGVATAGGWTVTYESGRLRLAAPAQPAPTASALAAGGPPRLAALRALTAAAWANPEWASIDAEDDAASAVLLELGLAQFAGWSVTSTSAA